ncbi:unnamed protein product [marine sediment metagenome]|uniref:Uncharacterized protein n=1 Tax=marine sediment metagenome TaxID=412755 RepID=X1JNY6_9ZZZZ
MPSIAKVQIYEKVKLLEREISGMKIALLKSGMVEKTNKKLISLEGIWVGVEITEEDIKTSQKSLFPQEYNL